MDFYYFRLRILWGKHKLKGKKNAHNPHECF